MGEYRLLFYRSGYDRSQSITVPNRIRNLIRLGSANNTIETMVANWGRIRNPQMIKTGNSFLFREVLAIPAIIRMYTLQIG